MWTVHEVSKMTGMSVRALHHYDAIGLLPPTRIASNGYRLYDETALERLQTILLFRELQFPLKEIRRILDSPDYDPQQALERQIRLLEMQRDRLEGLIEQAREVQKKGESIMDFKAFDKTEIERYAAEAKERWGQTQAYRECEEKMKGQSAQQVQDTGDALMALLAELGTLRTLPPEAPQVQEKVRVLQSFITAHYYTCTTPILQGLGEMYVGDERMKANIDRAGGEGTAVFAARAIAAYCKV